MPHLNVGYGALSAHSSPHQKISIQIDIGYFQKIEAYSTSGLCIFQEQPHGEPEPLEQGDR